MPPKKAKAAVKEPAKKAARTETEDVAATASVAKSKKKASAPPTPSAAPARASPPPPASDPLAKPSKKKASAPPTPSAAPVSAAAAAPPPPPRAVAPPPAVRLTAEELDVDDDVVDAVNNVNVALAELRATVGTAYDPAVYNESMLHDAAPSEALRATLTGALAVATAYHVYRRCMALPNDEQLVEKIGRIREYVTKVDKAGVGASDETEARRLQARAAKREREAARGANPLAEPEGPAMTVNKEALGRLVRL